jgi:hypothetical protein
VRRLGLGAQGYVYGIAPAADGWVVLHSAADGLQATRVTRAGRVLPAVQLAESIGTDAAIASNGTSFLVAVAEGSGGSTQRLLLHELTEPDPGGRRAAR